MQKGGGAPEVITMANGNNYLILHEFDGTEKWKTNLMLIFADPIKNYKIIELIAYRAGGSTGAVRRIKDSIQIFANWKLEQTLTINIRFASIYGWHRLDVDLRYRLQKLGPVISGIGESVAFASSAPWSHLQNAGGWTVFLKRMKNESKWIRFVRIIYMTNCNLSSETTFNVAIS